MVTFVRVGLLYLDSSVDERFTKATSQGVITLELRASRKNVSKRLGGTTSPSGEGAPCVEAFCETFCETVSSEAPFKEGTMCSIPAQPASENDESPISTGRGVSGGGDTGNPQESPSAQGNLARHVASSREESPQTGPSFLTLNLLGKLSAQRVTASFCDSQARKRWDNHPTKVGRRVSCSG